MPACLRRLSFLSFLLFFLLLSPGRVRGEILAVVNGDTITSDTMVDELARIHMMQAGSMHRADFSAERLLQKLINNRLIVQEAEAIGLPDDALIADAVARYRETLAYRALVKESLPDTITASEAEVRAEFERMFERVDLRFLCVNDSALAARLADSIRHGAPMDRLAREHSIDRYKDNGGLAAGQLPIDLPATLQPGVTGGNIGDVLGPNYLWRVWASIRIEARQPANAADFDSVKAQLRDLVIARKRSETRRQYIDRLGRDIPVVVDSVQVDSILVRMALGEDETERPVAAIAGDRVVTANSVRGKYIHKIAERRDLVAREVMYGVLQEQVDIQVLKEAAERSEVVRRSELDAPTLAYRDSLLLLYYLQDVIEPMIKVTDSEVAAAYEQNRSVYMGPAEYKVATITRETEAEAEADYRTVTGGTDFAWLARRSSTDAFKERGGEREWAIAPVFPPRIKAQLDSVARGAVLPPFETEDGYILMKLLDRKAPEPLALADVKDRIRSTLTQRKQLEAIDKAITALRTSADIYINEEALEDLRIVGPVDEDAARASD